MKTTLRLFIYLSFLSFISFYLSYNIVQHDFFRPQKGKQRKIVIILTRYRSGSTFFGQLFNKNPDAFYLFEPLYTFSYDCDLLQQERVDFLKNISTCQFQYLPETYKRVQNITKVNDKYIRCVPTNICFSPMEFQEVVTQYRSICGVIDPHNITFTQLLNVTNQQRKNKFPVKKFTPRFIKDPISNKLLKLRDPCGPPYNTTIETALCKTSKISAFKLIRGCSVSKIEDMYKELKAGGHDVYVINLIRDARASLASGFKLELKRENIKNESKNICGDYREKINFLSNAKSEMLKDSKFLVIRHEDMTMNASFVAAQVYRFIDEEMHPDLREWVWESSAGADVVLKSYNEKYLAETNAQEKEKWKQKINRLSNEMRNAYGTVRIPSQVLNKWRKTMSLNDTKIIQGECEDVLKYHKYKIINNEQELQDESIQTW